MFGRRVFGAETEYGLLVAPAPENSAPSAGLTAPSGELVDHIIRDYLDSRAPGGSVTSYLRNGSRMYMDMNHPEVATPEVTRIADLIASKLAAERLLQDAFQYAVDRGKIGSFALNLRVADHAGNTWGAHENYQVERKAFDLSPVRTPQSLVFRSLAMHLATRVPLCGSGGIYRTGDDRYRFVISQKAMSLANDSSDMTTHNKPLVNLRDEPLADRTRWARLHITSGDANLLPRIMAIGVASTVMVAALIEQGWRLDEKYMAKPGEIHKLAQFASLDLSCQGSVELANGRTARLIDIQYELAKAAEDRLKDRGQLDEEFSYALEEWQRDISDFMTESSKLGRRSEWMIRRDFLERRSQKLSNRIAPGGRVDWGSAEVLASDLAFDRLGPGSVVDKLRQSLSAKARALTEGHGVRDWMPSEEHIERLKHSPPEGTRAALRSKIIEAWTALKAGRLRAPNPLSRPDSDLNIRWNEAMLSRRGSLAATLKMDDPRQCEHPEMDEFLKELSR